MKYLLLTLAVLFLVAMSAQAAPCHASGWTTLYPRLQTAPQKEKNNLSTMTRELERMEPETCPDAERFVRDAVEKVSSWQEARVEPARVGFAFALRRFTDGAAQEALEEYLGKAIESSPRVFLERALAHSKTGPWCGPGTVANLGDYGAMSDKERGQHLKIRKKGLSDMRHPAFRAVRAQCLAIFPKS